MYHAVWAPTLPTLFRAISNGHYISFPGFTQKFLRKHLQPSIPSTKGHMKLERQNVQSTKHQKYDDVLKTIKKEI